MREVHAVVCVYTYGERERGSVQSTENASFKYFSLKKREERRDGKLKKRTAVSSCLLDK